MKYEEIKKLIEKIAPPELAEPWDNSGTQVYTGTDDIKNVLVCLEITVPVIREALAKNADMIISHHPLIFNPLRSITAGIADESEIAGMFIGLLIKNDICVYSAHTSFDSAPEGNNAFLAKLLGIRDAQKPSEDAIGVVGTLAEAKNLPELCSDIEKTLELPESYVRAAGSPDAVIRKVGICTGAGGDFITDALAAGCDALITGDLKFNQAQFARAAGIAAIDAGHYGTEKIFAPNFAAQLKSLAGESLNVEKTAVNENPYVL